MGSSQEVDTVIEGLKNKGTVEGATGLDAAEMAQQLMYEASTSREDRERLAAALARTAQKSKSARQTSGGPA